MNVGDLCSRPPIMCRHDDPIAMVATMMVEHDVGVVVVADPERRPIGIVTDRDLSLRLLARGRTPADAVHEVMTHEVGIVAENADPVVAARQMGLRRCRRLPVVDGEGRVVGIISTGDLFEQTDAQVAGVVWSLARGVQAHLSPTGKPRSRG